MNKTNNKHDTIINLFPKTMNLEGITDLNINKLSIYSFY